MKAYQSESNGLELSNQQLGEISQDFVKVANQLKEASYQIRSRGFSRYPIFVMAQTKVNVGQILIKKNEIKNEWNYLASYLDDFTKKDLIEKKNIDIFQEAYKDPEEFCCLFVIGDTFSHFVFIPYPID